jgi:nitrilase
MATNVGGTHDAFKIAAVQAAPVLLNREATVERTCDLIREAGRNEARVVVFPEVFIPGYPDWVWSVPAGEWDLLNDLYALLLDQAVTVPSAATDALCRAAREAQAYVVMGIDERNAEASNASLYNSLLTIDDRGRILGTHRKLVPTGGERLVWGQGSGDRLHVYDTPYGLLSGLICWENYMPLARYALYARGVQIYAAATWDDGAGWLATLRHVAKEGRCYVVGCCMAHQKKDVPDSFPYKERLYGQSSDDEWLSAGDSAIVNPKGEFIAGPVRERQEILYADVDLAEARRQKAMLDVAGHYARPDIFELTVHAEPRPVMAGASTLAVHTDGDAPSGPVDGRPAGRQRASSLQPVSPAGTEVAAAN